MWAKSAFGVTGIGALVLVDEKTKEIVVSVRGTIGLMNWITDAAVIVVPAKHMCKGCYMHSGFWIATREIHRTVRAEIRRLWALPQYRDFTLTVTGHSLGGAVAYLLRLQFAVDKDFCEGAPIDLVSHEDKAFISFFLLMRELLGYLWPAEGRKQGVGNVGRGVAWKVFTGNPLRYG